MLKFFAAACTFLYFVCAGAFGFEMDAKSLSLAQESVQALNNLDFARAERALKELEAKNKDFPITLLGKSMIEWSRYERDKTNPAQAKLFEDTAQESIARIRKWIKNNPPDAYAHMALGGVYGVKGRFELAQKSYLAAYFTGRKGLKHMTLAAQIDPQLYDAYFGEGMYQYYAGTLSSVVKILAKLIVRGDADKGLEFLNLVKDKGRLCADNAKLFLAEIYLESDLYRNPTLAAQYAAELAKKYPKNPYYKTLLAKAKEQSKLIQQ